MGVMTEERTDTRVLDDDPMQHAACADRYPKEGAPYALFVAVCGTEATMLGVRHKRKCPECAEIVDKCNAGLMKCPTCGKTPEEHG